MKMVVRNIAGEVFGTVVGYNKYFGQYVIQQNNSDKKLFMTECCLKMSELELCEK
jgi:O-glycosyl hydrolase